MSPAADTADSNLTAEPPFWALIVKEAAFLPPGGNGVNPATKVCVLTALASYFPSEVLVTQALTTVPSFWVFIVRAAVFPLPRGNRVNPVTEREQLLRGDCRQG